LTNINIAASGTFFIEDDGIPDNAGGQIRRDPDTLVAFGYVSELDPGDPLTFLATNANATVLNLDLSDPLGTTALIVGNLTNAAQSPDAINVGQIESDAAVTLVADSTLGELGKDAAADIVAASVLLSAGTGVGSAINALDTAVDILEAKTATGGINIVNFGAVTIGGLSDETNGLSVLTSGNLRLDNFGSITLADATGSDSIKGGSQSGNVTLNAFGADADITSTVAGAQIRALAGNVVLSATGDIAFGTGGTDFDNDVFAAGSITIDAGGSFTVDGKANVISDHFLLNTGGGITVNAADGIFLRSITGDSASISAEGSAGADVTLTAGSGSTLSVLSEDSRAVKSVSGDVVASADTILIAESSGISAFAGSVRLKPTTDGRKVNLGSATELGTALSLSDAELDRVIARTLFVGSTDSGTVTVSASIDPENTDDLVIESGADIVVKAAATVQSTGILILRASEDIVLAAGSSLQATGGVVGFVDFGNPNPGTGGKAIVDAGFASAVKFVGNVDNDTLFGGAANDILDGGRGADTLTGRLGDDSYTVDNSGDRVIEAASQGTDTVQASVSHTLAANVEKLILTGTGNISGTGNDLNNSLTGNSGNNRLDGGGLGTDTLAGAGGNDTYIIARSGVTIVEASNAGTDLVRSSITFSLGGKQVENLTLTASADLNGTGNSFDNTIVGNSGNNQLNGGTGSDTLTGGSGADTFAFSTALGPTNIDSITDYNVAADTVQLDHTIFNTIVGLGTLSLAQFAANASGTAQDANDRIIYDTDSGQLFFDSNGSGAGGSTQFATLAAGLVLTANDFSVVA
jgi:Ca2+-binding RTX toxin-like protein